MPGTPPRPAGAPGPGPGSRAVCLDRHHSVLCLGLGGVNPWRLC